jgi:hypothetical protein
MIGTPEILSRARELISSFATLYSNFTRLNRNFSTKVGKVSTYQEDLVYAHKPTAYTYGGGRLLKRLEGNQNSYQLLALIY